MSNSSSRAVYIPPSKRKKQQQQQERFHGAFTGGFSAGYFNTVDTKEGWKPSTQKLQGREQQRLEDFMDDQDHHEWGGPTTVRQDYSSANTKKAPKESSSSGEAAAPLESLLKVVSRPLTVGPRLLRRLGWREGAGSAFVPTEATAADDQNNNETESLSQIHLSKKRLRQIQLQSSRIHLPPPKLDHCGLGFEALEKAPEFQRYRQQRQEMARLRARGQSNVYRVSNVVKTGSTDEDQGEKSRGDGAASGGDYVSYETPEDFVGTRSVGGFALRDDEDDAYDPLALAGGDRNTGNNKPSVHSNRLLSEEYNTEIVELDEDSDIEQDHYDPGVGAHHFTKATTTITTTTTNQATKQMSAVLGGALASWATGGGGKDTTGKNKDDPGPTSSSSAALTSTGRPPVAGFRLGGSMDSHKKRYPGPDLPRDYHLVKRHVFRPHERPAIFQTIGRALQLEGEDQAKQQRYNERQQQQQHRQAQQVLSQNKPSGVLAGNQFATLAVAMKNRFTSASSTTTAADGSETRVGLYQPTPVQAREMDEQESSSATAPTVTTISEKKATSKPIVVRRTTHSFAPLQLLCKRFGVPVPRHSSIAAAGGDRRMTEASYFEEEVLSSAREGAAKQAPPPVNREVSASVKPADVEEKETTLPAEDPRPSRDKLKSIFEPESEDGASSSTSDDTDLDSLDGKVGDESSLTAPKPKQVAASADDHTSEDMVVLYESTNKDTSAGQDNKLVEYTQGRELQSVGVSKRESLNGVDESSNSSSEEESSSSRRKDRKRKRSHKKHKSKSKKRTKRSRRSEDDDDSSSSEPEDRRERKRESKEKRRRKHSTTKKRRNKKKHSSSSSQSKY